MPCDVEVCECEVEVEVKVIVPALEVTVKGDANVTNHPAV